MHIFKSNICILQMRLCGYLKVISAFCKCDFVSFSIRDNHHVKYEIGRNSTLWSNYGGGDLEVGLKYLHTMYGHI
jgi:hypothetical protein